ncbi:MAG: psd [Bacteroidetes bacterium]|nr:psd [Bacteroidota bacterium]
MITRYGYDVVGVIVLVCLIGICAAWFIVDGRVLKSIIILLAVSALVFTLYFFRDPDRRPPGGEDLVLAPADGTIVLIQQTQEAEYLGGEATQVSIFMSPLNVHVNRWPLSGTVRYFRHVPGEYIVAMDEKSSLRNERTLIGLETGRGKVLFKQIAGFIARRIVAPIKEGDTAVRGERFGMIKFGSRVDVLLPRGAELRVKIGDHTVAGETVLAQMPPNG